MSAPVRRGRQYATLIVLPLLLLLGACSERPRADGPITLVFKHSRIFGAFDPIPGLLREFEAAHPGTRVRAEVLPATSDEAQIGRASCRERV